MVYNCYIKCQVCGTVTRIRLQVGWQNQHPIVVICGECGTSLSGTAYMDQENITLDFEFSNAKIVNDILKADFIVECSGEFVTKKHCEDDGELFGATLTPFMRNCFKMDYEKFGTCVSTLRTTGERWDQYKRIQDLFSNGKESYLVQELKKVFGNEKFYYRNKLEILRMVHMIEYSGFMVPLCKKEIKDVSECILKNKKQLEDMTAFITCLEQKEGYRLEELQKLIYKTQNDFVMNYSALIPALSLYFYKEKFVGYEDEGSTTSDFESIKQFYIDAYEALGTLLIIPIGLNNIKYRHNFNDFIYSNGPKETGIDGFIKLSKANKFKQIDLSECFTKDFKVNRVAQLRNAIGHNDYVYDAITQKITYKYDPKDKSKEDEMYLLEMEELAINMFIAVLLIAECIYQLRKIGLVDKGEVPIMNNNNSTKKKIGRNDPCPCGSRLKYKKCCGR